MISESERREVAERLMDNIHEYGTEYNFFLYALGMEREYHGPCDWTKVHERLADLIDPTCKIDSVEPIEYGEFNETIGYAFGLTCGHIVMRPYMDMPPAYCDECGARVVDDE